MSGSNQYDKRTTTFNPDGRLLQVEYAIEHINQDAATVGILTKEGKLLVEKLDRVWKLYMVLPARRIIIIPLE